MNKFVIFLPSALDYEAEVCDLLVKIFWKPLSDLCLLSKSKILPSKEHHTPVVGSKEPSYLQFNSHCLRLDDYYVAGDDVDTLPLLFFKRRSLSSNSVHWHEFPAAAAFVLQHALSFYDLLSPVMKQLFVDTEFTACCTVV